MSPEHTHVSSRPQSRLLSAQLTATTDRARVRRNPQQGTRFPYTAVPICTDGVLSSGLASQSRRSSAPHPGPFQPQRSSSHGSGGWKSTIDVWGGMASPKASLRGLQMARFSRCPHRVSPLCVPVSPSPLLTWSPVYRIRAHSEDLVLPSSSL